MPITRYQIRNEYSLADPELYRAADRDDPEALLEGVAMAGLVGVLRQLGDLAEFAAEIFRDLHEEVMATASRGHGMMLRVHQLEAEFPSIEKAFLSQTSHSHFAYTAGIDWHANLRMDQNLITRGDLPRFIMDSYEECRGPPRLFLLDKFDVAGAGACLKRFSDPSFFKMELASSQTMKAEVQREKKVRKIKKKGARWRNGETQDILSTSHVSSKLHPVVSDEHNKVPKNTPTRRVKLRTRHLNGSSFHSSIGRSYMERVLEVLSPEIKVVCENSTSPSNLKMKSCDNDEPILEIREIRTDGSASKSLERDTVLISPPKSQQIPEPSVDDIGEDIVNGVISEPLPKPIAEIEVEKIPSTVYQGDQKELLFDGESKMEPSAGGYRSDDVASELDNYTDALTTMESEIETDAETRAKHEIGFFNIGIQGMDSDTNEQQELCAQCSDGHSVGNSSVSGDWNSSFKKGRSSLSNSDTLSSSTDIQPSLENGITPNMLANSSKLGDTISAENAVSFSVGDAAAEVLASTQNFPAEICDTSENLSRNGKVLETKSSEYLVSNGACSKESEITNHRPEFGEPSCSSCITDSTSALIHFSPRESSSEIESAQPDLIEISPDSLESHTLATSSNTEEVGKHTSDGSPHKMDIADLPSQTTNDIFPTGFSESCPPEMLARTITEVFSDALLHSSDIKDLPTGTNGYILENFHSTEYFEDLSSAVALTSGTQDCNSDDLLFTLPSITKDDDILKEAAAVYTESFSAAEKHLIIAPTKEELHDLVETDAEASLSSSTSPPECLTAFPPHTDLVNAEPDGLVVEWENVVPPIENLEHLGSDVDLRKGGLAEQELQTMTAGFHQLESEDFFDAEPPDVSTTNSGEFHSKRSGIELFSIKNEVLPNAFDCGIKDGSVPDRNCSNSVHTMENGSTTIDIHAQTDGSLTGSVLEEADCGNLGPDLTGSLEASGEHIKSQKECHSGKSASDQQELGTSETSYPDDLIVSDAQLIPVVPFSAKESTLPAVDFTDSTSVPCNLDFSHSSCSESFDLIHDLAPTEVIETQFQPSNGAGVSISPREDNQEPEPESPHQSSHENAKDAMSPSSHFLPDSAIHFDQSFGLHQDGEKPGSSHLLFERMQLTEQIDPPHKCEDDSSMDPYEASTAGISQPSEPEFHSDLLVIPRNDLINMLNVSSSTTSTCSTSKPEASIPFPPGHNFESSELLISSLDSNISDTLPPIFPSFSLLVSERGQQLSSESLLDRPGLGFPFPDHNTLQANAEEIPPLPPLPPLQWRIGKLRFGSPTLGETTWPQNTAAPLPTMENVKPFHDFISLEGGMAQPPNPFTPLPTIEDEKPQDLSVTSKGEEVQLVNSLTSLPTVEVEKPRHDAVDFKGEIVHPTNSFTSLPTMEDENPRCSVLTLEGEAALHPYSFAPAPAVGDEKLQHDVIILEGETTQSLNPFLLLTTTEDKDPNGNSQSERPRDPLIEAVAAHDKSTLRKASERVRPSTKPMADDRDNLLEQIRNKSFNLKPAVVTKPAIQGPKTNLNVAAILEKANAIRQALAGSDEDDDGDGWSDC